MILSFFREIIVNVFYFRNCNFEKLSLILDVPVVRNFLKNVKIRMIYERWFFVTTDYKPNLSGATDTKTPKRVKLVYWGICSCSVNSTLLLISKKGF